jgi:hypothetical protein
MLRPVLIALLLLGSVSAPALANEEHGGRLELELELFAWLPLPLKAESTVEGVELPELDLSQFDDVNLDVVPFFGRAELWFGWIGLWAEGSYIDLQLELDSAIPLPDLRQGDRRLLPPQANLDIDLDYEHGKVDFGVAVRLSLNLGGEEDGPRLTLSLTGGGVYQSLSQRADVQLERLGKVTFGETHDWLELLVGAGVGFAPVEWLVLGFRTELSGFGIGTGAELAWKWLLGLKWHPLNVFSLTLGWRFALLDISRGSGDDSFKAHSIYHGPYLGLGFHF